MSNPLVARFQTAMFGGLRLPTIHSGKYALRLMLAAALACGLVGCGGGEKEVSFEGKTISQIEIRYAGRRTFGEQRLKNLIAVKPGDRYEAATLDTAIKTLFESGLVDDVRFLAEPEGDSVKIIAEITTRPPMGPAFCIGNTIFSDQTLARECGLKSGDEVTAEAIEAARKKLEAFYVSRGYADVVVTSRSFAGGDPSPDDFIFVVEEGSAEADDSE